MKPHALPKCRSNPLHLPNLLLCFLLLSLCFLFDLLCCFLPLCCRISSPLLELLYATHRGCLWYVLQRLPTPAIVQFSMECFILARPSACFVSLLLSRSQNPTTSTWWVLFSSHHTAHICTVLLLTSWLCSLAFLPRMDLYHLQLEYKLISMQKEALPLPLKFLLPQCTPRAHSLYFLALPRNGFLHKLRKLCL